MRPRSNPEPPSNPHSRLRHTDQCLVDYHHFGYCDHTLLSPHRPPTRLVSSRPVLLPTGPQPEYPKPTSTRGYTPVRRSTVRSVLSYVGFGALVLLTYLLVFHTSPDWLAFLLIPLSGIGWFLVFTCGLPYALFHFDLSHALPPDTRRRLDEPDQPDQSETKKGPNLS